MHDPVAVDVDLARSFLATYEKYSRSNPAAALDALASLESTTDRMLVFTVVGARRRYYTWERIAALRCMPRVFVWMQYRRAVRHDAR